jgi:hypothetical protein
MNNLFDLNLVDEIIMDQMCESESFKEFSYNLDLLDQLYAEPLVEEVIDYGSTVKRRVSNTIKNTKETTRDVAKAYSSITDANAGLLKNTWNLLMSAVNLIVRIASFIVKQLSNIPLIVMKVLNKVMDIPGDIRAKIRGNIKLYITANDIENLYNKSLLIRIEQFIAYARKLSQGDTWHKVFAISKVTTPDGKSIEVNPSDIRICKEMNKLYQGMASLRFNETEIDMKNTNNVNTYFGDDKSIKFAYKGKQYECNYYTAVKGLMDNLNTYKQGIQAIQSSIDTKLNLTYDNSNYARLNVNQQGIINNAVQQISKVIAIIGNIIKYVMQDMKTIESSVDKVLQASQNNKTK